MFDDTRELWICLIEADGCQMPSVFYRRRDALALRVRGDDELGPLARRAGENGSSVIFQEGAIICASESLARQMAWLARDCFDDMERKGDLDEVDEAGNVIRMRRPTVSIGRLSLTSNMTRTRQDTQVLDRIEKVLGKRGRKPASQTWAVACTECVRLSEVEDWAVVNCPHCHGFLIHNRPGSIHVYADPGGDVFEAWKRTRFAGPHWEPAPITDNGQTPPVDPEILSDRESDVVDVIAGSTVLDDIRQMPRDFAFDFLDAIFINRAYRDLERRLQARAMTATEFFKRGGAPTGIRLTEPKQPDLVDAADVLGAQSVASWLLTQK